MAAGATQLTVSPEVAYATFDYSGCGVRCLQVGDAACGGFAFSESRRLCKLYSPAQMADKGLRVAAGDFDLFE